MCSRLHFRTLRGRTVIIVDAVGAHRTLSARPARQVPAAGSGGLLWAQSCLLPQGTAFIQREPPDLALSGRLSSPPGDRPQPRTDLQKPVPLPSLQPSAVQSALSDEAEGRLQPNPSLRLALLPLWCPKSVPGFKWQHPFTVSTRGGSPVSALPPQNPTQDNYNPI